MEQITLDMIPNSHTPIAHISQYDSGRHIRFNLQNITLTGSETVTLKIRKADGELVSKIIENHTNYVEYVSEKADCDVSGKANCEIVISKDDVVIGSKNFIMNVEADAYDGANVITKTASGAIASFETNIADVLQSLKCEINASGGNGTPDNPIPIVGHSELNIGNTQIEEIRELFTIDTSFRGRVNFNQITTVRDNISINGITATKNNDNSWNISGTASAEAVLNLEYGGSNFNLYNDHIYFIAGTFTGGSNSTYGYGIGGLLLDFGGGVVWKNSNHYTRGFSGFVVRNGVTVNLTNVFFRIHDLTQMFGASIADYIYNLEQSQTGTGVEFFKAIYPQDYYPYNVGQDKIVGDIAPVTVAFGQTVYGGTYDKSGRLTITWAGVNANSLSWEFSSEDNHIFRTTISDIKPTQSYDDRQKGVICSHYPADTQISISSNMHNETWLRLNKQFFIRNNAYSDVNDFVASLSGVMLAYELETPIIIDVSSISVFAEKGTNNVFGDTGDTEVKYLYIA